MSLGTLVVGLGQIGMGYDLKLDPERFIYSQARAFSRHPAFRLIAGVDPSPDQRNAFESEYRRPAFADVAAAVANEAPDIVVIAVPTPLHGETLTRVLELSQPRAILCEKPLSYDIAEATAMVELCRTRQTRLFVNYIRRSDPGAIEIKRRLDRGEIRPPIKGVVWYSKGLTHNGSHFVNLLQDWLGPVLSARVLDAGRAVGEADREPDVRLTFAGGVVVLLAAREEDFSHYTIELVSSNGRLRYERGGRVIEWQGIESDEQLAGYTVLSPDVEYVSTGMQRYQWHVADELAAALEGNTARLCDGTEALETIQTLHAILNQASS